MAKVHLFGELDRKWDSSIPLRKLHGVKLYFTDFRNMAASVVSYFSVLNYGRYLSLLLHQEVKFFNLRWTLQSFKFVPPPQKKKKKKL